MGTYYFDSSGLAKRYVNEAGSIWVESLTDLTSSNEIVVSLATGAEVAAAICKQARTGALKPADATNALNTFKAELQSHYIVLNLSYPIIYRAMDLSEKHGLKGYDSIQLATALELQIAQSAIGSTSLVFYIC